MNFLKHVSIALLVSIAFTLPSSLNGQTAQVNWLTEFEKSGGTRTPRYDETMAYCRRLESASPWIRVASFGKSPQGRDLPLVIVSRDGTFDPVSAHKSGKAILLIQNGIHAGEIDGKDACLMLMRDMVITKTKAALLDHVIFLFIPIYNVDGHERFGQYNRINQHGPEQMGWRVTAQNLNLNRDYLKADAPETQAFLGMFTRWLPDFFIDAHVTDGADFQYIVTYAIETHDNLAPPVRDWVRGQCIPMLDTLKTGGVPVSPYIFLRNDRDPLQGLSGGTAPPRFSTTYMTLQNRPALLIETHMLKEYKPRVEGTLTMIESVARLLNRQYRELREAVDRADEETAKGVENPFPLSFDLVDTANLVVPYLGLKQVNEPSEVSGGTRIVYSAEPFSATVPRFDSIRAVKSVHPPVAYLIPPEWQEVIRRLRLHGVQLERLVAPLSAEAESYRFSKASWQREPYEGRHPVTYTVSTERSQQTFPAGTVVLRLHQRAARVALHALEPDAPDAFSAWGFFDAVFEQKEYAEEYVMESLARTMLESQPSLAAEFKAKLASDSSFAHNPNARLDFFYRNSNYWDQHVNLYPIARLMENIPMQTEPLR